MRFFNCSDSHQACPGASALTYIAIFIVSIYII